MMKRIRRLYQNLGWHTATLMALASILISCGPAKKPPMTSPPPQQGSKFFIGILFDETIDTMLRRRIIQDGVALPSVTIVSGKPLDKWLRQSDLDPKRIFDVTTIHAFKNVIYLDYFFGFTRNETGIVAMLADFGRHELSVIEVSEWLQNPAHNTFLNPLLGFMLIDAKEPGVKVFLDYKLLGQTPLFLRIKDGSYTITLAKYGQTLYEKKIKTPEDNNFFYNKDVPRPVVNQMQMAEEDRRDAKFLSTLAGIILLGGMIAPIIILL